MGESHENLLKAVRHYQESLDKYTENRNDGKLLHYLEKLYKLPIKVIHLEQTGVGRTVNGLRKLGGEVGDSAKCLVSKWKEMVVGEQEEEDEDEDDDDEEEDEEDGYQTGEEQSNESDEKDEREEKIKTDTSSSHRKSDSHRSDDKKHKHSSKTEHESRKDRHKHDKHNGHVSSSKHKSHKRKSEDSSSEEEAARKRVKKEASSEDEEKQKKRKNDSDSEIEVKKEKKHKSDEERKKQHKEKSKARDSSSEAEEKMSKSKHKERSSKDKHKSRKEGEKRHEHSKKTKEKEKKGESSKSKESHKDTKNSREKSEEKKHKSSKSKSTVSLSHNGIDSGSGASFAEALGMCEPSSSKNSAKKKMEKKEKEKTNSNNNNKADDVVPKLLKEPIPPPEPLDINISSLLPPITPNYRPLGNLIPQDNQPKKCANEYEALSNIMTSKNQRTKVYSGNKTGMGKVPSLFELCIRVLQDNIDALEYTGGVPYNVLKPILEKSNPNQLYVLEHHNPYLIEDTDELWRLHCQKEFRNKKREEFETWREMYLRCLDERDAKLKALTANIKQAQDKSLPVRTTKLAYVDAVAKPPRNIARKQLKNGTTMPERKPTATKLSALATAGEAGKVAVPNPGQRAADRGGGSSHAVKPKKAPLMLKSISSFKNRFKR